jgi:hypothetical protein
MRPVNTDACSPKKGWPVFIGGAAILAILSVFPLWAVAAGGGPLPASVASDSEAEFGIRVVSLRPTAGGRMLDLRFRVDDSEKAKAVLTKSKRAYLLDGRTGKTLPVPTTKAGAMRQTTLNPEKGRVYFMLFANPGGLVKEGGSVSLVIGDFRKNDLIVESAGTALPATEYPLRPGEHT